MTKETLSMMFNKEINGFFIKKDILISREKIGGKKVFLITDISIDEEINKPVKFNSIDDLFNYTIDNKKIADILSGCNALNIDNQF